MKCKNCGEELKQIENVHCHSDLIQFDYEEFIKCKCKDDDK